MQKLDWEIIEIDSEIQIDRAKVIGGWLVRCRTSGVGTTGAGLTFVPDSEYAWDLFDEKYLL